MNTQTPYPTLNLSLVMTHWPSKPVCRALFAFATALMLSGAARAQAAGGSPEPQVMAFAKTPSLMLAEPTLSDRYAASLRERIAGVARYPASREAHQRQPAGRVGLWVEIDRSGRLVDARITAASADKLLDLQALRDLRNARYAAFPTGAFAGENSHRFLMTIQYAPSAL